MTEPIKILAVDDEPDFELLISQSFRRQIRAKEFLFRFAHHGEEAIPEAAPGLYRGRYEGIGTRFIGILDELPG